MPLTRSERRQHDKRVAQQHKKRRTLFGQDARQKRDQKLHEVNQALVEQQRALVETHRRAVRKIWDEFHAELRAQRKQA
jgi:hypothetical protein